MYQVSCASLAASTVLGFCIVASLPASELRLPAGALSHQIKLGDFVVPPTGIAGLLLKARVNGGPPLSLLLDSGSQYVVLNRKAAARSGCVGGFDLNLIGAGANSAVLAKRLPAADFEIGDLTIRRTPLLITDQKLPDGMDGIAPLSIFSDFLIRLDFRGHVLELLPYPQQSGNDGALPSTLSNGLMFVRATVNESREGYFLIDTGASYTAISHVLARQLILAEAFAPRVPLQGGAMNMEAPLLEGAVKVHLESQEVSQGPVVSVDLSTISRYHNFEISGLIGYRALRDSVMTINYRDSLIRIAKGAK